MRKSAERKIAMYKTNTDWTRNKKSAAIIYTNADGNITEITLARFLSDSPENTVEMFNKFKAVSDKLFYEWDREERTQAEEETPLEYVSEKCAVPSAEKSVIDRSEEDEHEAYIKRKEEMTARVPSALDRLTDTQRRRYVLHHHDGLSIRRIAEIEGVFHKAVADSITQAQKKIEKIIAKEAQV